VRIAGASTEDVQAMHDKAHANCFIANSVNFPVRVEAQTEFA
jgi:organic hydroperoxide reductase OsmC/OhrA